MTLNLDKSKWKRVAFGDVVRNVNVTVRDPEAVGIDRVIAMEHMDPGELQIQRWGSFKDGTTFTRRVRPGQTLFGKRRAYQRKVAYAEFDAICSGDILTFEPDKAQMMAEFLPFLVQSNEFFDHALGTSAGSLSPRTNWRDLSSFEFDLPPLDDQRRIVDLLWAIEANRDAQVKVSKEVSELSITLFAEAVEQTSITSLSSWVARIDAGRSPLAAGEPAGDDEFGVLKVSAVGRDAFVPSENKRLLDKGAFRPGDSVHSGDLLVTRANAVVDNVARPCMVDRDYPNLMLSDKTLRLVPAAGYPNRVVLAALQAPAYRAYVREAVNGTEAKNISQQKILAGPVPDVRPEAIQHLFDELTTVDSAASAVARQLAGIAALRSALLSDVFRGN